MDVECEEKWGGGFGIIGVSFLFFSLEFFIVLYDLEPAHPVVVVYRYWIALLFYVGAAGFIYGLWRSWKTGEIHVVGRVRRGEWKTKGVVRRKERPLAFVFYFTVFVLLALGLAVVAIILTLVPPDQW